MERAAELEGDGVGQPQALLKMVESGAPADAQRRTRQHHGRNLAVKLFLERGTDLDRGAGQGDALPPFARDIDPVDLTSQGLCQPLLHTERESGAVTGCGRE